MRLRIRRPDDWHRHPRRYELLQITAKYVGPFGRIIGMGNTKPAIADGPDVTNWRQEIDCAFTAAGCKAKVLIAAKVLKTITPAIIDRLYEAGAKAIKIFFEGSGTTGAEQAIPIDDIEHILYPALDRIRDINKRNLRKMFALWHLENPNAEDGMHQEVECLPIFRRVVLNFPGIKMVMEHVSTAEGIELIENTPDNIAATLAIPHLRITHDHITRWGLQAGNYCRPEPQFARDRRAIVAAAISGNPKFFLGSDDAPHLWTAKSPASPKIKGMPGVCTGPYTYNHYAEVFNQNDALDKLENFGSVFGAQFYEEPLNEDFITLVREPITIPEMLDGIAMFMPGETLNLQVA